MSTSGVLDRGTDKLHDGRATAHRAARSDATHTMGQVGLAARGVLYLVIGVLAGRLAFGAPAQSADKQGALRAIETQPFGGALLIVLTVGLAAYALWCVARVVLVHEDSAGKAWAKRAGNVGRAVLYGAAAASAVSLVLGDDGASSGGQQEGWTATLMGWPAGRWLVGLAGLGFLAAAGWNAYRGISRKFRDHLETGRMSPAWERAATVAGVAGFVGRAVALVAIGVFVVAAAVQFDPTEPVGLDGSLRALQDDAFGPLVLTVVAVGLVMFGVYSLIEARWREQP